MNALEKWRTERKLSYQQAAVLLGLNRQTIANMEKRPLDRAAFLLLKGFEYEELAEKMERLHQKRNKLQEFINLVRDKAREVTEELNNMS